jgi:ankyrin repeat protein
MEVPQELVKPFVLAAHGDLEQVKAYYAEHPEVLTIPLAEFGDETALMAASHTGRREIAEFLLSQGAPLTLCCAAMLGRLDDVKTFIVADPSQANAKGAHGITLMFHAAFSGNPAVGEYLLSQGGGEGMNHALFAAIASGKLEMVEWVLRHATDVNTQNFNKKTPLRVALDMKRDDIAEAIRKRGGVE